jgi:membrane-associated protease RseP (regulator of RpoE activity)
MSNIKATKRPKPKIGHQAATGAILIVFALEWLLLLDVSLSAINHLLAFFLDCHPLIVVLASPIRPHRVNAEMELTES